VVSHSQLPQPAATVLEATPVKSEDAVRIRVVCTSRSTTSTTSRTEFGTTSRGIGPYTQESKTSNSESYVFIQREEEEEEADHFEDAVANVPFWITVHSSSS